VPEAYRLKRVGEVILPPVRNETYEIAKAGGRHWGVYERFKDETQTRIEKSIRSYEQRIAEHADKIQNPDRYLKEACSDAHRADLIGRYWPNEIADYRAKIEILRQILARRSDG